MTPPDHPPKGTWRGRGLLGLSTTVHPSPRGEALAGTGEAIRDIIVLAFNGITLTDLAGSVDMFDIASRQVRAAGGMGYSVTVASVDGGSVLSSCGIPVGTVRLDQLRDPDTLLVLGGGPPDDPPVPEALVRWLVLHAPHIRRICAMCTGTFLLAEAALLDHHRATTHWAALPALRRRHPAVLCSGDPCFVRDGRFWTSAGFSAGFDLTLSLIEEDHGRAVATELARSLVLFAKRSEGQPQASAFLASQARCGEAFRRLEAYVIDHLSEDLSVPRLAALAGMTPRTFARQFAAQTGRSPAYSVELLRLEKARSLLTGTSLPLKRIAKESGFADEQRLRRAIRRAFGVTPQDLRDEARAQSLPKGHA